MLELKEGISLSDIFLRGGGRKVSFDTVIQLCRVCVCALTIVSPDEILHYIATLIMIIYYVFKLFCFSDSEVVGLAVPFAVVCAEQHHHRNPG